MGFLGSIVSGRFLVGEKSYSNWKWILIFVSFGLFMIYRSHETESMVMEMAGLKKELNALRAQYIESSEALMRMKLESNVRLKVEDMGIQPSLEPPYKIYVD